jgi:AcrR family transcriptional regulator
MGSAQHFIEYEMDDQKSRRRRGSELETAILEAAWLELVETGYYNLTLENIAKRAGTSRTVLNRRWGGRAEVAAAAVSQYVRLNPLEVPDVGNLRAELIFLLTEFSRRTQPKIMRMVFEMGADLATQDRGFVELGPQKKDYSPVGAILKRAVDRSEIKSEHITPRLINLPTDLARHEIMVTQRPLSEASILSIVDDVFLPLVTR